jgi:hypothetical protein
VLINRDFSPKWAALRDSETSGSWRQNQESALQNV